MNGRIYANHTHEPLVHQIRFVAHTIVGHHSSISCCYLRRRYALFGFGHFCVPIQKCVHAHRFIRHRTPYASHSRSKSIPHNSEWYNYVRLYTFSSPSLSSASVFRIECVFVDMNTCDAKIHFNILLFRRFFPLINEPYIMYTNWIAIEMEFFVIPTVVYRIDSQRILCTCCCFFCNSFLVPASWCTTYPRAKSPCVA